MSDAFGAGIQATTDLFTTFLNKHWRDQEREHAENRQDTLTADERAYADKIRSEDWAREDQLLAEQRAREDTSYQRSVADAMAAGLSPLAVSQLNAAGIPVNQSSGISSAGATASSVNPASYMANAPQMDISGLTAAYFSQANLDELKRHNKAVEENDSAKISNDFLINLSEINQRQSQFEAAQAQAKDEGEKNRLAAAANIDKTVAGQIQVARLKINSDNMREAMSYVKDTTGELIKAGLAAQNQFGLPIEFIPCSSFSKWQEIMLNNTSKSVAAGSKAIMSAYNHNRTFWHSMQSYNTADASSSGWNGNIGYHGQGGTTNETINNADTLSRDVGTKKGSFTDIKGSKGLKKLVKDFFLDGVNAGLSHNKSESSSDGKSYTRNRYVDAAQAASVGGKIVIPILIPAGASDNYFADLMSMYKVPAGSYELKHLK